MDETEEAPDEVAPEPDIKPVGPRWKRFIPDKSVIPLYIGHSLSSWGDRIWFFALPISFATMYPTTLLPVTLFQFFTQVFCILFGNYTGYLVDSRSRLSLVRYALILQNVTLSLTATMMVLLVYTDDGAAPIDTDSYFVWPFHQITTNVLFILSITFGALTQLASMVTSIALQKDWSVVVASANNLDLAVRRIDLLCATISPIVFSLLLTVTTIEIGLVILAVWNLISLIPEYICVGITYKLTPQLSLREEAPVIIQKNAILILANGWKTYVQQPILLPSIGFVFLFFTILQDGPMMLSFLKSGGNDTLEPNSFVIPDTALAGLKACGAICGVLATISSPLMIKKLGTVKGGLVGIWFQFTTLAIGCVYVFMASIVLSRFGLYGFDLAEIQIMQDMVPERERGVVNSTEKSLTKVAEVLSSVVGIFLSRPSKFFYFIMLSLGAVFLAAMLYSIWAVKYHRVFKETPPVEEPPSIKEEEIPDSVELLETGQNEEN